VNRGWEFVSKETEFSLGKFVPAYFTPQGGNGKEGQGGSPRIKGARLNMTDETETEKSFCLSRPDGWVINREKKKIVLLEFKRTSDVG
jgi:hypothetical protein